MIETIFLIVLIFALVLGNIFLSLTSPKRLEKMAQKANEKNLARSQENSSIGQSTLGNWQESQSRLTAEHSQTFQAKESDFAEDLEKEKANYLTKRIERLEQLLLKINNSKFIAQKLDATNLAQKLKDFDEFKQNTRLEIAALRQRLDKSHPQKEEVKQPIPDISDDKLHDLVFRVSN